MKYEDYVKVAAKQGAQSNQPRVFNGVRYFALREDGESAVVRFNITSDDDLRVEKLHRVKSTEGKLRTVKCLRTDALSDVNVCPLCAAGEVPSFRAFIPVVYYEQDEENKTVARAGMWEQSPRICETLKSFIADYGDLRDYVFKIVRHGARGDTGTSYTVLPANPNVYKEEVFKKDFSGFENFDFNRFVNDRTAADMETFLEEGDFPAPAPTLAKVESRNLDKLATTEAEQKEVEKVLKAEPTPAAVEEEPTPTARPRRYTY